MNFILNEKRIRDIFMTGVSVADFCNKEKLSEAGRKKKIEQFVKKVISMEIAAVRQWPNTPKIFDDSL